MLQTFSANAGEPETKDTSARADAIVVQAAEILHFAYTRPEMASDYIAICNRLVPLLERMLQRLEQDQSTDELTLFTALVLLAACYRALGDTQTALKYYTRALQIQPYNAPLHISRGILLYGTSPRAIVDFEYAIQLGSPDAWPYFFLAHHFVTTGRFDECRSMCERGLRKPSPLSVKSELWEWLAISQAELGYPVDVVRASFESALRVQPSNIRAKNNLKIFEDSQGFPDHHHPSWENRSASVVRTFGHEERTINTPTAQRELASA